MTHFGACYGYDASLLHERHYALTVMGVAGALTESGKAAAVAEVTRVGGMVAKKKTWEQLSQSQLVKTLQQAARKFGQDLTKKKLGQIVFAVGVLVGGCVNTWYLNRVTNAAYYAYRERFLKDRARLTSSQRHPGEEAMPDAELVDDDEPESGEAGG